MVTMMPSAPRNLYTKGLILSCLIHVVFAVKWVIFCCANFTTTVAFIAHRVTIRKHRALCTQLLQVLVNPFMITAVHSTIRVLHSKNFWSSRGLCKAVWYARKYNLYMCTQLGTLLFSVSLTSRHPQISTDKTVQHQPAQNLPTIVSVSTTTTNYWVLNSILLFYFLGNL